MTAAPMSHAATLQQRMERMRRARAAAQALRVAFPEVQQLRLELRFEGTGSNPPASQSHVLHPAARAFFEFPCPYTGCNGHFDLTRAVSAALADPGHQVEGTLGCSGMRAREYALQQPCELNLLYTITATYQRDT